MNKPHFYFLSVLLLLSACAPKTPVVQEEVHWRLSPEASLTYYYLRARDELALGNFYQAGALLDRALAHHPDPDLYMEAARAYWRAGEKDKSLTSMEEALDKFPDKAQLYIVLAELYLLENREDESMNVLERYRRNFPDDLDIYQDLASFYIEMGKYPEVVDLLQEVPLELKTPEMLYYIGRASNMIGDRSKALSYLRQATEQRPDFFQAWAELAFIYEQDRNYLKAIEIYKKLLQSGQRSPDLYLRLVELHLKLNNPDSALEILEQGPIDYQFRLDAAYQFIQNSFYSGAQQILEQIMDRGAYPPTVYFYLALTAYQGWSDPDRALSYLSAIPEDDYYHMQSLSFSIQIYFEQEQYFEALELSALGQTLHPRERSFILFEAIILETLEEYSAALNVLEHGLGKWPMDTDFLFRKGVVWDKKGNREKTIELMEKIITIDQDHHEALNYVGYTLAEKNRDLERALVLINRALQYRPSSGHYIDSLAWVYYKMGKYSKAWTEIQRAVEFLDDDPIVWEHYGDIALALDKPDLAIYGYKKALEYDPENPEEIMQKIETLHQQLSNN
ncbi:tetratricopeptide repeat protein [Desulfonatronovibrio magnus]|uniref:tetratricopeptide repeat protein n=1 Tax=Desulfonatronovibrio magnus TaxID=698827 RepID=UPI0005EB1E71|nr:tetratricopeptide repeat protein [Desulfonatronovibrio magnus]RQD66480.1 MAG: tetratricopeptide repeat protein [Desulfonatronovibrio sp. MSAO_Bac4]